MNVEPFVLIILWGGGKKDIIWRHDIDVSAHRALWMAKAEAKEGLHAIYFVLMDSPFYNMMERDVYEKLLGIRDLGHEIGIHLDCESLPVDASEDDLVEKLSFLKGVFENVFQQEMKSFAFHVPNETIMNKFYKDKYAGLCNAYSKKIREQISYCSDSEGYWRFRRLEEFIQKEDKYPLCVLTHPVWWTPEVMSPAERVKRAIEGRSQKEMDIYNSVLCRNTELKLI
ncbi:hypothetical protein IMSAGC002_02626 [Lachnospiraceae bacterium]|nr:hypothetical protein IMSAGC002_02626 [Lachnospiraceae bacterium]